MSYQHALRNHQEVADDQKWTEEDEDERQKQFSKATSGIMLATLKPIDFTELPQHHM
jgi:hypothetical protein